jgi:hypothetical protein
VREVRKSSLAFENRPGIFENKTQNRKVCKTEGNRRDNLMPDMKVTQNIKDLTLFPL